MSTGYVVKVILFLFIFVLASCTSTPKERKKRAQEIAGSDAYLVSKLGDDLCGDRKTEDCANEQTSRFLFCRNAKLIYVSISNTFNVYVQEISDLPCQCGKFPQEKEIPPKGWQGQWQEYTQ